MAATARAHRPRPTRWAGLERLGHDVVGYDRADGDDLLDLASARSAADGRAAVVHAGALAHDSAGSPEDIMAVNGCTAGAAIATRVPATRREFTAGVPLD
jgi:hypothetical protein